ncbi:beta strand repeat-containing protein [Roseateles sp. P5_E7]
MSPRTRSQARLKPLALAAALAVCAMPAQPTTFTFSSNVPNATWDLAGNWSPRFLPGVSDIAKLGAHDVTVRSAVDLSISSFTGTGTLGVTGSSLSFAAASTIGTLNVSGGTLTGAGTLAVANASSWTGGTMSGTGSTTFSGELAIGALTGSTTQTLVQRSLILDGGSKWAERSTITLSNGATLTNNAGHTFDDQGYATKSITSSGAGNSFVNAGTYKKSGAGFTTINTAFTNSGTLALENGFLTLAGTTNWTGNSSIVNLDRLTVAGNSTWSGNGSVALSGFGGLTNGSLKTFDDQNDGLASLTGSSRNSFNNYGTFSKSGGGTTTISIAFSNSGTLAVNKGTLNMSGGYSGNGSVNVTGTGTLSIDTAATISGSLNLAAGTLTGAGTLNVSKASTWMGGTISGNTTNPITFNGGLTISGSAVKTLDQRNLTLASDSSWSGNGTITLNQATTLTNSANKTFDDKNVGAASLTGAGTFKNAGTYTKSDAGTTTIKTVFDSAGGTVTVNKGTLAFDTSSRINGGTFNVESDAVLLLSAAQSGDMDYLNVNGGTLSGQLSSLRGTGNWTGGMMKDGLIKSFGGTWAISGPATKTLSNFHLTTSEFPAFWVDGGSIAFTGNSVITAWRFYDGHTESVSMTSSGAGNRFENLYDYYKGGVNTSTIEPAFVNDRRAKLTVGGGKLVLSSGVSDQDASERGSISVASGATLMLGADSTTGSFAHAGTLELGASHLSVALDYSNTGFGVGNAFNRRAGVTGTGQILALGNVQQTLSGSFVQLGNTASAVLALPSTRVGDGPVSTSFKINNIGNGASLRGAIQDGGITSAALSGSGVTAQNWGALAAGGSSGSYTVTYPPTGASAGLTGQSLAIVNNFDNVAGQTLNITGGKVYAPAVAQLGISTLDLGIVHVGDMAAGSITVRNAASVAALNDGLWASASAGGAFVAQAGIADLAAGQQDSLLVKLDASQAGVFNGTATLDLFSRNADMSDLTLASQQVTLKAQVNHYAELGLSKLSGAGSFAGGGKLYTLNFGTLTEGSGNLSAELAVGNLAEGLADMLGLKFELGTASLHFSLNGFGPVSGLAAGDSQGGLQVGFSGLLTGRFDEVVTLHAIGSNASGYAGALGDVQLRLVGEVAAVPEPASWAQLALGLAGLLGFMARRRMGGHGDLHARG